MTHAPILRYADFYDVPHVMLVRVAESLYLLDAPFDDELDDYSPEYNVYRLPPTVSYAHSVSWDSLMDQAVLIGKVPAASLQFDSTKRASIVSLALAELVTW
jgi:hypothetical protein